MLVNGVLCFCRMGCIEMMRDFAKPSPKCSRVAKKTEPLAIASHFKTANSVLKRIRSAHGKITSHMTSLKGTKTS